MNVDKDAVVFKGNEDGILIIIDDTADYDDIKAILEEKSERAKGFFKGGATAVTFKGKPLMSDEKEELLKIISEKSGLSVSMVDENSVARRKKERARAEQERKAAAEKKAAEKGENETGEEKKKLKDLILETKNITDYHIGSLRSGMCIDYKGSVVVIGDVNPGAEIKAEGNVIVLGKLKGVVHAGCKGDRTTFVAALYMRPTQLIIGDIITFFSEENNKDVKPEYAYIKDERIYVEVL